MTAAASTYVAAETRRLRALSIASESASASGSSRRIATMADVSTIIAASLARRKADRHGPRSGMALSNGLRSSFQYGVDERPAFPAGHFPRARASREPLP